MKKELLKNILNSSIEYDIEDSVLTIRQYYGNKTIRLDLSLLDNETLEKIDASDSEALKCLLNEIAYVFKEFEGNKNARINVYSDLNDNISIDIKHCYYNIEYIINVCNEYKEYFKISYKDNSGLIIETIKKYNYEKIDKLLVVAYKFIYENF